MANVSASLPDYQVEGLDYIARETGMNKSEIIQSALSTIIDDWSELDNLPEWIEDEAQHDRIIRENRSQLRAMHFKQTVYEYLLHDCLTGEDDTLARYPPSPEKVKENYGESVREQIKKEFDQYEEEYEQHLDELLEWYELCHPETGGETVEHLIEWTRHYMRWHDESTARAFLKTALEKGDIPNGMSKHDLLDEARERKRQSGWKEEWDNSIHPQA